MAWPDQEVLGCDTEGLVAGTLVESPVGNVVNRLMQVAVNGYLHTESDRQSVERAPAVRVPTEALVAHEDVGALTRQVLIDIRENRRPVPKWQAAAPSLAGADDFQAICDAGKSGLERRCPYAFAKDAAES